VNRPDFPGGSITREDGEMERQTRFSAEVRERSVRMVLEQQHERGSQWAAMESIAAKIGCTAETLRKWVRRVERDSGQRAG